MFHPVYNRDMAQNISVPDIGDFKDVEVIEILVKPGDQINKNDPIVTIESDKSSVEIPSPSAGQIKDLEVKIGDKVSEGSLLATIENGQAASSPKQEIKQEVVKEVLEGASDISLWGLFFQADIVVKLVMLILILASGKASLKTFFKLSVLRILGSPKSISPYLGSSACTYL